eukprot:2966130-Rhodomonas_salina.2
MCGRRRGWRGTSLRSYGAVLSIKERICIIHSEGRCERVPTICWPGCITRRSWCGASHLNQLAVVTATTNCVAELGRVLRWRLREERHRRGANFASACDIANWISCWLTIGSTHGSFSG